MGGAGCVQSEHAALSGKIASSDRGCKKNLAGHGALCVGALFQFGPGLVESKAHIATGEFAHHGTDEFLSTSSSGRPRYGLSVVCA